MAKKIGIIVLLCFSLCVGGVSAFANEGYDETDTQTLIETQPPVSSVLFRQDGADIQQSTDEGKTWQSYSPIEETFFFQFASFWRFAVFFHQCSGNVKILLQKA